MRYLLDTNVCVDFLNGRFPSVVARVTASDPSDLGVSAVVVSELRYGAERSQRVRRNQERLDVFLSELTCVPFDDVAAREFGRLRARLESEGRPIGAYDMQIAAQALALDMTLVTDNTRELARVRGLRIENWRLPT